MGRLFTLAQAERALPEVERLLRDALFHKAQYQTAEEELARTVQKIRMAGGSLVDVAGIRATRDLRNTSVAALKQALEAIEEIGALVKDLDIGLIDFMTVYQNREVCLCWKLGEEAIRFWHGAEEGFRGRKLIDGEFLNGHHGDIAN
jgi:hypothetical protein